MDHLIWARLIMAFSLGFHIIFAAISMVMPFYMAIAYRRYLKTNCQTSLTLTHFWSKGVAVLFAIGAVSGTVLSFELGLLWPGFMEHAGPIIGMPFSLEGAAFFLEAIFLGLFLYGWGKMPTHIHWVCGLMVGVCGLASGILVVAANGWMNAPSGFVWVNGHAEQIDPWKAFFNEAWPLQATHMTLAAFQATGFMTAGLHALALLKNQNRNLHLKALRIVLPLAFVASLLNPIVGDFSAKSIAQRQPEKLAALEAHFHTEKGVGLWIGGIPDETKGEVRWGIQIPKGLSFLAFADFNAEVKGLHDFPEDERPPVLIPHFAFQIMVGIGSLLLFISLIGLWALWKKRAWLYHKRSLSILAILTPSGMIALEMGWIVTEVGRQPWIIYKVMKVSDSVTQVSGLFGVFVCTVLIYTLLGCFGALILYKLWQKSLLESEV
jgi:cytochrome bd ubiquinol oxidase subunit I